MIRVALNLVYLVPGETGGMEVYARELIPRLAAQDGLRLTALVNREAAREDFGIQKVLVPVHARRRIEWVRGEQQHVPRLAALVGADVVHSLASTAPVRGAVARVTTIHDLNYAKVPGSHFGLRGLGMRLLVPAAARRSQRIIVDATSTRDDLVADLRIPFNKIDVVPLGVTEPEAAPIEAAERARKRFELGDRPVVLSVSAKRPHKNLGRLLRALAAIPKERRPLLVIPGYRTPHEAELRTLARDLRADGDVRWPEWVSAYELEDLYATATCLVFPSLYEGFGLPVLEAMARGVPVATSGRASLAEVAGEAAVLFDPEDVNAIRGAIEKLLADRDMRHRLAALGRERARTFTWERTARMTAASYRKAVASLPARGG